MTLAAEVGGFADSSAEALLAETSKNVQIKHPRLLKIVAVFIRYNIPETFRPQKSKTVEA
jgi:hypothetical protein